jgi:hypothetical protein
VRTNLLQIVIVAALSVIGIRLYRGGLHRKYRVFFAYLAFCLLQTGLAFGIGLNAPRFFQVWAGTAPLLWLLCAWSVLELYQLVLERHPGLQVLLRRTSVAGMITVAGLTALSLLPGGASGSDVLAPWVRILLITERGIALGLLVLLVLIVSILSRYPLNLSRSVALQGGVYCAFFLSHTVAAFLLQGFGLRLSPTAGLVLLALTAASAVLWLVLLDVEREARLPAFAPIGRTEQNRLLEKLNALNSTLLRSARK